MPMCMRLRDVGEGAHTRGATELPGRLDRVRYRSPVALPKQVCQVAVQVLHNRLKLLHDALMSNVLRQQRHIPSAGMVVYL